MILPSSIILFFVFLAISAFFSSSETAFIAANPYILENLERKGSKRARTVRRVLSSFNEFLAAILIGNTLVNAAAASLATSIFAALFPGQGSAIILSTIATTALILVFSELTPKTYAAQNPQKTAMFAVYPIKALMVLFFPVNKVLSFFTELLLPSSRTTQAGRAGRMNEEELRLMLRSGAGGLSAVRRRMITGALDIDTRSIKEIMVPRPQVKALSIDASLEEVRHTIESCGFTRYPVCRDRLDNVEGVFHAKDLIKPLAGGSSCFDMKSLIRPAYFIPDSASIEDALVQMQANSIQLAFVADEFGSVDGIVTLEDILEELVGDIRDEHDKARKEPIQVLPGPRYMVDGSVPVKDLNLRICPGFPEDSEYSTIAGFVLSQLGRLPQEKETFVFAGYKVTVEKMSNHHIVLVSIEPLDAGDGGIR
jgi:putative hemolysin